MLFAFVVAVLAVPALGRPPLTADNAPEILTRMTLTDDEFGHILSSIFTKERYEAGYCTGNLNGLGDTGQKHGRAFFKGYWAEDRKTKQPDLQYRPGPILTGKTYKRKPYPFTRNPFVGKITTVLRYAPVKQPAPVTDNRPQKRIDMKVEGRVNHASGDKLIDMLDKDEAYRKKQIARASKSWKYTFTRDLKFGLDRNSMSCSFNMTGRSGEIRVDLAQASDFTSVHLYLTYDGGAISQKAAVTLARNAAAVVSNKVWGKKIKLEKPPGQVGIIEAYTASKLGKTPVEDTRETKFQLGKPFYVAIVYRPDRPGARTLFNVSFTPSAQAITASREMMPRYKENRKESLGTNATARQMICLTGAGGVDEMTMSATNSVPFVKTLGKSMRVLYVKLPTEPDPTVNDFWRGSGQWEVQVSMDEYRSAKGDETTELSTDKLKLNLIAGPAFLKKYFKPKQ
jgi:hypothetical protein